MIRKNRKKQFGTTGENPTNLTGHTETEVPSNLLEVKSTESEKEPESKKIRLSTLTNTEDR